VSEILRITVAEHRGRLALRYRTEGAALGRLPHEQGGRRREFVSQANLCDLQRILEQIGRAAQIEQGRDSRRAESDADRAGAPSAAMRVVDNDADPRAGGFKQLVA